MDGRALLETVGETYARLKSFEVEILSTHASGDEDHFSSNSQRARAFFVAPDKMRIERGGAHGSVLVTDGVDSHRYFAHMKQYSRAAFEPQFLMQGSFRPEFPMMSEAFLFARIAEKVVSAEIVREEEDAMTVVVEYEAMAQQIITCSAVTFRVDRRTNLVAQVEGEVTSRFPGQEMHASRNSVVYSHAVIDREIPAATFEYAPPADAVDQPRMGRGRGGGSGFARRSSDGKKDCQEWHSSWWEGEEWREQKELRLRGVELKFERRLSFEGEDLRIAETITGPLGVAEREFSIKVRND